MTPTEFKAWFEGFCEAIDAAPTPEQWAKIKAKVADMGGPVLRIPRPDLDKQFGTGIYSPNIAQNGGRAPVSHETRVVDALTGADLGPSD